MRTLFAVWCMVFIGAIYIVFVAQKAIGLIVSPTLEMKLFGFALIVFPLFGVWALWREMRFGFASARLSAIMQAEEEIDAIEEESEVHKQRCFQATQEHPENWKHWYRLGVAYDRCKERSLARLAVQEAIKRFE